jgi:hypothetical protein
MANRDGKSLEALVQFVEEQHLPPGCTIKARERVYEDGVQVAELDIKIKGKLGTTDIAWLIECRDRPSDGPQNGEWVDGLYARGQYFGANKVTAVSTTGFTHGARKRAEHWHVELREVQSLEPDAFKDWMALRTISRVQPRANLRRIDVFPLPDEAPERVDALKARLLEHAKEQPPPPILKASKTGELMHTHQVFGALVDANPSWLDGLLPNGLVRRVQGTFVYQPDDHFVIGTSAGEVGLHAVVLDGDVSIIETEHPIIATKKYVGQECVISELAVFESVDVGGRTLSVEFHRMAATGETLLVGRLEPGKKSG